MNRYSVYTQNDEGAVWHASYSHNLISKDFALKCANLTAKLVRGEIYEQINDGELKKIKSYSDE